MVNITYDKFVILNIFVIVIIISLFSEKLIFN